MIIRSCSRDLSSGTRLISFGDVKKVLSSLLLLKICCKFENQAHRIIGHDLYLSLMCESNPLKPPFCRILFIILSFSLPNVSLCLSSSSERQLRDKICFDEFWHMHTHQRRRFSSKEWSREVVLQYSIHPGVLGRLFLNGNDPRSTNVTAVRRGLQMRLMFCVFFFLPFFHSWFRFGSVSHSNLLPSSQMLPSLVEKSVPPFNGWIGVLLKLFFLHNFATLWLWMGAEGCTQVATD